MSYYQEGYDKGYADGYAGKPSSHSVGILDFTNSAKMTKFEQGYDKGYKDGKKDRDFHRKV